MEIKIKIQDNIQKIGRLLESLVTALNSYGGDYSIETEIKLEEKKEKK